MNAGSLHWVFIGRWFLGTTVVCMFARKARWAFIGGMLLFVPEIVYATSHPGYMEMLGIVHLGCAGLYAIALFHLIQWKRRRRGK